MTTVKIIAVILTLPVLFSAWVRAEVPLYWVGEQLTRPQISDLIAEHPFSLGSLSRKPIGIVYLCFDVGTSVNPGGLGYKGADFDLTTGAGLKALQSYLNNTATTVIKNLQACHAQGIIVWDFDGEPSQGGWPAYIGAPNQMMQADGGWWPAGVLTAYQDFVGKIKAAGFAVGCCLRCDTLIVKNGYPVKQLTYQGTTTAKADLLAKCSWAYQNLSCTLFYWDSYNLANGNPAYDQYLAHYVMEQLGQPLLITCEEGSTLQPPQEYINSYADSPLYCPLPAADAKWDVVPLNPSILAVYPAAFCCVNVDEGTGITPSNYSALFDAFGAGQALPLFQCWWGTANIPYLKQMVAAGLW
jgi:hypothetical protein